MKEALRVYRFEHPETGVGPYVTDWELKYELQEDHAPEYGKHPTIRTLFGGVWSEVPEDAHSALISVDAVVGWFGDWIREIEDARFILREYITSEYVGPDESGQVAFYKSSATMVS